MDTTTTPAVQAQTELEKLEDILGRVKREWEALESAKRIERDERMSVFEDALRKELSAKHDEAIAVAQEKVRVVEVAVYLEKERIALSGEGLDIPLGTRLLKWELKYKHAYASAGDNPLVPTGIAGIVEAVTRQSEHPLNLSRYSRAKVGEFVIRLLKKDGTPSARYIPLSKWESTNRWFREGVDPNDPAGTP